MAKKIVTSKQAGGKGLPKQAAKGTLNGVQPHTKGGAVKKAENGRVGGKS